MIIEEQIQNEFSIEQKALSLHNIRSATDLKNATQDFETLFIQKLLNVMQEGMGKNDILHSKQEEMWRSMLNEEYAKNFSKAGGIGLADMLYEYLAPLVLQEQGTISPTKALEQYRNSNIKAYSVEKII